MKVFAEHLKAKLRDLEKLFGKPITSINDLSEVLKSTEVETEEIEYKPYSVENRAECMGRKVELRCHMKIVSFYTTVC
jgi:hypothetical protein